MKLTIPFYLHKAGAGFPSPATDYIEEDVDLNVHLIKNVPATFIIRVQGKSMTDVGIYDGDLLVIIYAINDNKVGLAVGVTKTLEKKFDAVKIVRAGSEVIGGKGGGGRADFAQAGGTLPDKIEESFENIKKLIN
ncbi:DHHA1 domain-containing protein [Candidatus Pelagibacter ubique]|nr:DHHA1 domain-containing protein [Candidatus Pelagibacter ubique]